MITINIITAEDLDTEWTNFLDSIPSQDGTVESENYHFEVKRMAWIRRMAKTYDVGIDELIYKYIH